MTRTHLKHYRVYVNGVNLSGTARTIGSLDWSFDTSPDAAITDAVKNVLVGQGNISAGSLNAFLENDAAQLFAMQTQGTRTLLVAMGANAAPVAGNPMFAWMFEDKGYMVEQGDGFVAANLPLSDVSYSSPITYKKPWGVIVSPETTWTGANSATGIDDNGASSALGGIFCYQLLSSDGTATLKIQDAATNSDGDFGDLSGATSGSITAAVSPKYGMVALSPSATVRRFLRAQVDLGTATTLVAVFGFIRGNGS